MSIHVTYHIIDYSRAAHKIEFDLPGDLSGDMALVARDLTPKGVSWSDGYPVHIEGDPAWPRAWVGEDAKSRRYFIFMVRDGHSGAFIPVAVHCTRGQFRHTVSRSFSAGSASAGPAATEFFGPRRQYIDPFTLVPFEDPESALDRIRVLAGTTSKR